MTMIDGLRSMKAADIDGVKAIIDSTELFPSAMLDDMTAGYLAGEESQERWWVVGEREISSIVYCSPERMTQGAWNLLLLAVRADRQGQGIGRAAVGAAEVALTRAGARLLLVETSGLPEFERTRRFYRLCGYEQEARIRDYYRAGEDKIVFRKALT